MADSRKHCTYEVNGITHTAMLDADDQKRLKAKPVSNKAAPGPQNKASDGADDK